MCTILEIEFCKFENIKPQIMKTKLFTLIISVMAIFGFTGASGQDASYKQLWEQMREADKKDHPKTVVEICDKIVAKARRESNRGQLLKAWFTRVEYKTRITPDTLYSNLRELETWARDEKDPVIKMMLHSCIASIYSNYVDYNSWAINGRTNVEGGEDTPDIKQWGSIQFVKTINDNVNAALSDMEALRKADNSKFMPFNFCQSTICDAEIYVTIIIFKQVIQTPLYNIHKSCIFIIFSIW